MALTKATNGGTFFDPKEHVGDLAIVIEGKKILKDQPCIDFNTKQASTRDEAVADIYCFRNSQDIENREPSLVIKDARLTHWALVNDLEKNGWMDGGAGVTVIRRPGKSFVYRPDVEPDAEAAAVAWYEARNTAREEAKADMPSFLSD